MKSERKVDEFVLSYSSEFKIDKTLVTMLSEWLRNFETNYENMNFKSIHDLPKIKDSALIVDHSFTGSFERQAEYLKEYKGTIFACDRALWKMLKYGVVPDYVVNVDSSYLCTAFFDWPEVREHMDEITAIFAVTTFPLTIRTWTGKRVFFTPNFSFNRLTESVSAISRTDICQCGGCVHNTCWAIAYALGAKTIGLYGIDNSYDKPSQAEHGLVKPQYVKELDKTFYVDEVYKLYAKILIHWIGTVEGEVETINTTENGIMYSSVFSMANIKRMPLKDFVGGKKKTIADTSLTD